jgi:hypothetical protein
MSGYYSLDDTGINAAYKEQQFKYSAEQYRLRRVLIAVRRTETVNMLDIFLRLKQMTGLFMRKMHHGPVMSHYSDNPQLIVAGNGRTKV